MTDFGRGHKKTVLTKTAGADIVKKERTVNSCSPKKKTNEIADMADNMFQSLKASSPNSKYASFKEYRLAHPGDSLIYNYCYDTSYYGQANYGGGVVNHYRYYEERIPT